MGQITRSYPRPYQEELEPITARLQDFVKSQSCPETGWFFRFDGASPKDGKFDFPVMSAKEVITQIVTSRRASQLLSSGDRRIYITAFDHSWDPDREVRAFICDQRLTAVSQYNCYVRDTPIGLLSDKELSLVVSHISDALSPLLSLLVQRFETDSFVADIYVEPDLTVRIIEFNPFGHWLPSGSALFHWLEDADKLHNAQGVAHVRVFDTGGHALSGQ
ncbi:hypothetical protein WJX73_006340 [Symbiochloris irregularis]|uniref:Cell division cycle protein 123 n=1 Tax=Symbiochloris irregularis TaxID=706552 RepID=A0AAW1NPY6_9CHLO